MNNIFIIGRSRSGKTPLATKLATELGMQYIKASEWIRKEFPQQQGDRNSFITAITAASLQRLRENPRVCLDYITTNYDLSQPSIIDGARNPHDFVHLFRPQYDTAIILNYTPNNIVYTPFEQGIEIIKSYLDWLSNNGIIRPEQVQTYTFDKFFRYESGTTPSLDEIIDNVVHELKQ